MIIRQDRHGLYIRSGEYGIDRGAKAYRPGYFSGHSHAYRTDHGGLKNGDKPKTSHVSGAPFIRIKLSDGEIVYWGRYGRSEGDFPEEK